MARSSVVAEEIVITGTRTERQLGDVTMRIEFLNGRQFVSLASADVTGYLKQGSVQTADQ